MSEHNHDYITNLSAPASTFVERTTPSAAVIQTSGTGASAAEALAAELAAVQAETSGKTTQADMQTAAKQLAVGFGFRWVRENVTATYGRTILSELTDEQVAEVYARALADAFRSTQDA